MPRRVLKRKDPPIPPEIDLTSDFMDPEKVKAANNIRLPYPSAKTYNNLAEYYSHTFLQKNNRKKTVNVKEIPRERNYAWYYSTIGYDPSYGNEYYCQMNKDFNNRKRRRKGKKGAHTSTIPCEPLRSEKVVFLKSKYKVYCRRKFPKWFKEFSSSYESSLDQNPKPRMSLDQFVVRIMESNHVDGTSTSLPLNGVKTPKLTNSNRNVLLKFDKNTDPLSFLKCIIFGKVDINRPLNVNKPSEKPSFDLPLPMFAQSPGFVPNADIFLCVDVGAANKTDNSAYETESSGYMSDCSEIDRSTQRLKTLYASRTCGTNSIKSENASRLSKLTEMSAPKSVLTTKENSLALETQSGEDALQPVVENSEVSNKQSIIVSINRKWITVRNHNIKNAGNPQLKENKLPVGCKCNAIISKEMSYQCTCGFYTNAVNEVRKFKIPRKRASNISTANTCVIKKERKN